MKKYRILEKVYGNGEKFFFPQKRFIFWWVYITHNYGKHYFLTEDEAYSYLDVLTKKDILTIHPYPRKDNEKEI